MFSLLKIEWLKIKKYPAFWWMFGIIAVSYPSVNAIFSEIYKSITGSKDLLAQIAKTFLGNPFAFPEAWHSVAYFSSAFVFIPAVLVIMLINNEYSFKTHRQNVIDGWNRSDFIASKLIDVAIVSLVVTVVYIIVAVCFGIMADSSTINEWGKQLQYIPLFLLQTFAQLSMAFLCGYLIRKAFLALGVFLFYSIIVENILFGYLRYQQSGIRHYLPLQISDELIPEPAFFSKLGPDAETKYQAILKAIPLHIGLRLLFTTIVWVICFVNYKKRDL